MFKKIKFIVISFGVSSIIHFGIIGCNTIPKRNVVIEEQKPNTDIELYRKLDEWTEQLRSDDPSIRSSAAVSLLGLNLLDAQEPLITILKDEKEREEVKISIIKAFGFTRDDRGTETLIDLLDHESVPLQSAAANALGRIRSKNAVRLMSRSILDPEKSREVKLLLAKALGNINDRDAVGSLIKLLATNDRGVRDAAKKSLEKITKQSNGNDFAWWKEWWNRNKTKTREQWLEEIVLKQEENTKQLEEKIEQLKLDLAQKTIGLIKVNPEKTDPKFLSEALKSDYPEVRIYAAKELAKIKSPLVIDTLIEAITDEQEEVRIEVAQALGEIDGDRVVNPLISVLDDESLVVREKAAKALGKLERKEAVQPLISALINESSSSMICSVVESLGQISDLQAVEPLIPFLKHKEPKVRECTAAALGKLSDKRAVEPLIVALDDKHERVRWYAADSLGKIGDPVCVEYLIKLLSDESARVRESAVAALGQIGNQQAIESLISALQDVDERVAEHAAEALVNIKDTNFGIIDTVATTFYKNKDYKRAEIVLERQIEKYASQPEFQEMVLKAKTRLAKTLYDLKDWQKAVSRYEEIIKHFPGNDTLKVELIRCLKEMKRFDRALEWYTIWIEESPMNNQWCWKGRLEIAKLMYEQGLFEKVRTLIGNLREEDPALGGEEWDKQFRELAQKCIDASTESEEVSHALKSE